MIRSLLIIPVLYRLRSCIYKPFVFPEGCRPNLIDPSTFETNYMISDTDIENILNYTLANDTKWEELIYFDKSITHWEHMMRFGIN